MHDLIEAWDQTRTVAKLHVGVDENDETRGAYRAILKDAPPWVRWSLVPTTGMGRVLNYLAEMDSWMEPVVGFMGDDHRPRTQGWDELIIQSWLNGGRVIYGNDLIQGPNLPTAVALDARIIQRLGYMAPPELQHMYFDNFWRTLGQRLNALRYLPDVVIEHMHPIAGKAEWDEGYVRVNAGEMYHRDGEAYGRYVNDQFENDVKRIGELDGS